MRWIIFIVIHFLANKGRSDRWLSFSMAEVDILSGPAEDMEVAKSFAFGLLATARNSEFRHPIRFPVRKPVCSPSADEVSCRVCDRDGLPAEGMCRQAGDMRRWVTDCP